MFKSNLKYSTAMELYKATENLRTHLEMHRNRTYLVLKLEKSARRSERPS